MSSLTETQTLPTKCPEAREIPLTLKRPAHPLPSASTRRNKTSLKETAPWKLFNEDIKCENLLPGLNDKFLPCLQLRSCRLQKGIWSLLTESSCRIQELKLDYTNMHEEMQNLAEFISSCEAQKLSLIWTKLQNYDLSTLKKELEDLKERNRKIQLHSLCLMHTRLTLEGFEILAEILNLLPIVEELDITNCALDDDALKAFQKRISKETKIRSLSLGRNTAITPAGMTTIRLLAKQCQIKRIDISRCELEDDELKELTKQNPGVQKLIISGNPKLSCDLMCSVKGWATLEEIDVRECCLFQEDLEMLKKSPGKAQVITGVKCSTKPATNPSDHYKLAGKSQRHAEYDHSANVPNIPVQNSGARPINC